MTRLMCPACGGRIQRTRKLDRFMLPRFWDRCLKCGEASWDLAIPRPTSTRKQVVA